ncbi:MAG: hypothetical protein EBU08_13390 [Micrococcales bacterium]|nr:hypothetical protein [Micrococcales bacterium]
MQTFLPEYTFVDSAAVLDQKRLVKQLLEGRQIMAALSGNSKGWRNHPATRMWQGHAGALYFYLMCMRNEMDKRGYKWENNWNEIELMRHTYFQDEDSYPDWMTTGEFAQVVTTHRANLHIKAPDLYPQYALETINYRNDVCCERCNYHWPTHVKDAA